MQSEFADLIEYLQRSHVERAVWESALKEPCEFMTDEFVKSQRSYDSFYDYRLPIILQNFPKSSHPLIKPTSFRDKDANGAYVTVSLNRAIGNGHVMYLYEKSTESEWDHRKWLCIGKLPENRTERDLFFEFVADCCGTGFAVAGTMKFYVTDTLDDIVRLALTDAERRDMRAAAMQISTSPSQL